MGGNKVHSHEPLSQRNLGIFEDSANGLAEVRRAVVAVETSVNTFNALDGTTMRTDDILAPTLFAEYFLALGFDVKVGN